MRRKTEIDLLVDLGVGLYDGLTHLERADPLLRRRCVAAFAMGDDLRPETGPADRDTAVVAALEAVIAAAAPALAAMPAGVRARLATRLLREGDSR